MKPEENLWVENPLEVGKRESRIQEKELLGHMCSDLQERMGRDEPSLSIRKWSKEES